MNAEDLKVELQKAQAEFDTSDVMQYFLISNKWLDSFFGGEIQEGTKVKMNQDLILEIKTLLQYQDPCYNTVLRDELTLGVDFQICDAATFQKLQVYPHVALPRKVSIVNGKRELIWQLTQIRLAPISRDQAQIPEGIQLVDTNWTVKEFLAILESTMQQQLSYQVPSSSFIRLYAPPEGHTLTFRTLRANLEQFKQLPLNLELRAIPNIKSALLVMDIQQVAKDFYFKTELEPIDYELLDESQREMVLFENQQSSASALLKCYQTVQSIRDHAAQSFQHQKLRIILAQSYYGFQEIYHYDDYELLDEVTVYPKYQTFETVYINGQPEIKSSDFNFKEIPDSVFQSSTTGTISENFVSGAIHQVRALKEQEKLPNSVKVKLHLCYRNEDAFFDYQTLLPIQYILLPKEVELKQIHTLVHSILSEQTQESEFNFDQIRQIYTLVFRTDQKFKKSCSFCKKEICSNCEIPYNDQKLTLPEDCTIYVVYPQDSNCLKVKIFQNQIERRLLKLGEIVDFQTLNDKFIIFNLEVPLEYELEYGKYKLASILDAENHAVCMINQRWIEFPSRKETSSQRQARKLIYTQ